MSIDAGAEIGGKLIELLAKAVGKLSNIRMLLTVANQEASLLPKAIRAAAEKMNIPIRPELLQSPINEAEYRRAFDAMQRDHVDGVVIPADSMNYTYRVLLGRLAQQYRLPAICWFSGSVEAGALMSYAAFNLDGEARRLAAQVVQILNGGNPAEMPFFQETHFDLVINLKAAKELGLELPADLVASEQADRVKVAFYCDTRVRTWPFATFGACVVIGSLSEWQARAAASVENDPSRALIVRSRQA